MDKYEKAYKKSCDVMKVEYKEEKVKIDVKKLEKILIIAGLTIAITSSTITGLAVNSINDFSKNAQVTEYISEYSNIVLNNTHRTKDNKNYWYDIGAIASELLEDKETFLEKFYTVYRNIGYNEESRRSNLDNILLTVSSYISGSEEKYPGFEKYDSFDDFMIKNNFVDKKGKPSEKEYEKAMIEYINAKSTIESFTEGRGR